MKEKIIAAVEGIQSDKDRIRAIHFETLLPLSEQDPELLYGFWDLFVSMLRKPEVSNKYYAIHLIANLVSVDTRNQFDDIFDEFYALLNHESPVVSPHIAGKSGKIMREKPHFRDRIVLLLLNMEQTSACRQIELQKAYAIDAFSEAFDHISQKDSVIGFVRQCLHSDSPKTRKRAQTFLSERYG